MNFIILFFISWFMIGFICGIVQCVIIFRKDNMIKVVDIIAIVAFTLSGAIGIILLLLTSDWSDIVIYRGKAKRKLIYNIGNI